MQKTAYICGPLTGLSVEEALRAKKFYERIADLYLEVTGVRAFVPHEHCDPVAHSDLQPNEVDAIERRQICELSTILLVVANFPSWGGGIEVEMANQSNIPVIIIYKAKTPVSRLLRGNPAVKMVIPYEKEDSALCVLRGVFEDYMCARL